MKAVVVQRTKPPLEIQDLKIDMPRSRDVFVLVAGGRLCRGDHHSLTGHRPP